MKEGPSIAAVAALAGDPARANMLAALAGGQALTAAELANEAGVTAQTASSHLAKLEAGGLIAAMKQGRHRYFRLAAPDVADMLETMMGVAARMGHMRTRPGPSDPALRKARVCYDHLAGEMGVRMFDSLKAHGRIAARGDELRVTMKGEEFAARFGIEMGALAVTRRPLCKPCLDWSMRKSHLAGALGAALLDGVFARGWAKRERGGRAVLFTRDGETKFARLFPI
jgi:DNA-binding transcriptional ArsR family regulator